MKGFTLIELLVVVAIIGIISAIAYPAYQGYIKTTYITQASADLNVCALGMERHYSNGFTYVGAAFGTTAGDICINLSPADSTNVTRKYDITLEVATATAFTLRATPAGEACGSGDCIEINHKGEQTSL